MLNFILFLLIYAIFFQLPGKSREMRAGIGHRPPSQVCQSSGFQRTPEVTCYMTDYFSVQHDNVH